MDKGTCFVTGALAQSVLTSYFSLEIGFGLFVSFLLGWLLNLIFNHKGWQ